VFRKLQKGVILCIKGGKKSAILLIFCKLWSNRLSYNNFETSNGFLIKNWTRNDVLKIKLACSKNWPFLISYIAVYRLCTKAHSIDWSTFVSNRLVGYLRTIYQIKRHTRALFVNWQTLFHNSSIHFVLKISIGRSLSIGIDRRLPTVSMNV
jgi:hypothetical protein